jgi:hypothetical protein
MPKKITDSMIITAAGSFSLEAVGKVRRILVDAGVPEIELHRLEIEALRKHRENARVHTAAADRYLASGPLPDHGCLVDDAGIVTDAGNCPFGCRPQAARLTVE